MNWGHYLSSSGNRPLPPLSVRTLQVGDSNRAVHTEGTFLPAAKHAGHWIIKYEMEEERRRRGKLLFKERGKRGGGELLLMERMKWAKG